MGAYQYAGNNPIKYNDPRGDYKPKNICNCGGISIPGVMGAPDFSNSAIPSWVNNESTVESNAIRMSTKDFNAYYGVQTDDDRWRVANIAASYRITEPDKIAAFMGKPVNSPTGQPGKSESNDVLQKVYDDHGVVAGEVPRFEKNVCWWCDDQGTVLFNHWRNGNGVELFLNDPVFWGDYMRAHEGLRDAIESEMARKFSKKEGAFKGRMRYNFGGGYQTGYQMLGGSNDQRWRSVLFRRSYNK